MNDTLKIVLVVVVLAVIAYVGVTYPQAQVALGTASSGSGVTNSDAKIVSISMTPTSVTATSTSILNYDATDRIVTDSGVTCTGLTNMFGLTGAGLATFRWGAATSSTASPAPSIIDATLAAMNVTVATSTSDGFTATTTFTNPYARRWNANSYMIFQTNATSSAAACTPYIRYISS